MESRDVVVVGAGLAGLDCARRLSRAGLSVLLVDRKATLEARVHTTGIFVRRTLEDFEFPEGCLGPPVRRVMLYSPGRRALELESPHDEFRVGRMGRLYRANLLLAQREGAAWAPATRFLGLEAAGTGSVVTLESRDRRFEVQARFVIGADGAVSRVARDLALDVNREFISGVEDVFEGLPAARPPSFHCFIDPRLAPGYLAWLVDDGEEAHVGVGGYAHRFRPLAALEAFERSLGGLLDLDSGRRLERRGGRIPVGGVLRRIVCPRGLLVGDAAGAVSPLTAGGLDPCLRLSRLAAEVTVDYLAGGDRTALERYSGDRFRARFFTRRWLRRTFALPWPAPLVEAGCAALRHRPLKALAWHVFFGRGSFPEFSSAGEDHAATA
ncbi:MAG: NAD(P)/FAD-dependent oxidoreductase [Candidatus Dormibacteraeota bacterium]|nr:NAD(P)/FAD-dependent oxidoreductase [Candidatus Dormibacteraeota bacterium]